MKRAVILGGAGFIGRWLARSLSESGAQVVVIDLQKPAEKTAEWVNADARDLEAVGKVIRSGDCVVHLFHSSIPEESLADPDAEREQNVVPYASLVEALADAGAGMVVYSSTGGQIYGEAAELPIREDSPLEPVSPYGRAKLEMENITREITSNRGLPHLIVRIGNPYGPFQELTNRHGVIPALFRATASGEPFIAYGGGVTVRDYVFVEDAARAVAALVEAGVENRTVNVGTGAGVSLADLIRLVEEVSGKKIKVIDREIRSTDVRANVLDVSLLQNLTGWRPRVSLSEGLSRTWEYLKGR